jgi:hypothetical protein
MIVSRSSSGIVIRDAMAARSCNQPKSRERFGRTEEA